MTHPRTRISRFLIPLLALLVSAAACGDGDDSSGDGDGDGDGDASGDGDGDTSGDGDRSGDGDGDGDRSGDGDGDTSGDGDGSPLGGAPGTGGATMGGASSGSGGESPGTGGDTPGTGGDDPGTGGTMGLDCPLEEYELKTCEDDGDCDAEEGCLRNVCVALCGESLADLDAGLAPGITPWAHLCGSQRAAQTAFTFNDDGCDRAYVYSVNVYRVSADPDVAFGLNIRRLDVDPSRNAGSVQVVADQFEPTGNPGEWSRSAKSHMSPDGSTIAFEVTDSATVTSTIVRVDTDSGAVTMGPTLDRGTVKTFLDNTHLLIARDSDPSATINMEWAVVDLTDDSVAALIVADTTQNPDQAVALPNRGALLISEQPDTVYALPWADVTAAVAGGTAINRSTDPGVLTLSEPYYMMPLSNDIIGYSDFGSATSYQTVGEFGATMLDGGVSEITLENDPTYWGNVVGIGGRRVALNLFMSVMIVDVP